MPTRKVIASDFGDAAIGKGGRVFYPTKLSLSCGHTLHFATYKGKPGKPTEPSEWPCSICDVEPLEVVS